MAKERVADISITPVSHQLVFVTGLHRSGTSLLHRCLRDHPQASGFLNTGVPEDEGQHLQSVIPSARPFGGPGRFGFRKEAYLDENAPLATSENAVKLLADWGAHWDLTRPVLLEKSPTTMVRTRFFQALFPQAKFVVALRHPLAVAFATYKWKGWTIRKRDGQSLGRLLEHWLLVHEKFAQDMNQLQHVKVVLYEELVRQPEIIFNELTAFLNLEPFEIQQHIRSNINEKYFQRWSEIRDHPLKSFYANHLLKRFEKRINRFGYSLDDLSQAILPPEFHSVNGTKKLFNNQYPR